jgi:MOSC domain-containing protein YiiM
MPGRLIGIARAPELGAPMQELDAAAVTVAAGVEGDARGPNPGRQVTVLFREGWEAACREVPAELPWTTRRANLYVEGLEPPREVGARLRIGDLVLEVAQETAPCAMMERAQAGLRAAMRPDWRGGVCCAVIAEGAIRVGDNVALA